MIGLMFSKIYMPSCWSIAVHVYVPTQRPKPSKRCHEIHRLFDWPHKKRVELHLPQIHQVLSQILPHGLQSFS